VSPPDIDVDFSPTRREEIFAYLRDKYGADHVARICTFGKMKARQAIRDAGRALERNIFDYDRLSKLIPEAIQGKTMTIAKACEVVPELKALREQKDLLLLAAEGLEDMEKSLGQHASGIVISNEPMPGKLPLATIKKDNVQVTQYDMNDLEDLGYVKFDILGLRNLDVIVECVRLVKEHRGITVDWRRLPEQEDEEVFKYLKEGKLEGIFQMEGSEGIKQLVVQMEPQNIEDISAAIALFRPGPLSAGMMDHYLKVRQGVEQPEYLIAELEDILKTTEGQLIYQEQIMKICRVIAGYTAAEADIMRKIVGKKKAKDMAEQKDKFISGGMANGHDQEVLEKLFDQIEGFASYSFNCAHSVAYAFVSYTTAYLKYHYRLEYYTALLNTHMDSNDRPKFFAYLLEMREEGIKLLAPDINTSQVYCSIDGNHIRYGLGAIKHVSLNAIIHIIEIRNSLGRPFANFRELVEAVDANKVNVKIMEALAKAGAFDSFEANRRKFVENCRRCLDMVRKLNRKVPAIETRYFNEIQRVNQLALEKPKLHGGLKLEAKLVKNKNRHKLERELLDQEYSQIMGTLEYFEPYTNQEFLSLEKAFLGFYLSGHPLDYHEKALKQMNAQEVTKVIGSRAKNSLVRAAGTISNLVKKTTKKKQAMATFILEDAFSALSCVIMPKSLEDIGFDSLQENVPVVVLGKLRGKNSFKGEDDDSLEIIVNRVELLVDPEAGFKQESVRLQAVSKTIAVDWFDQLLQLLQAHPGDTPVQLIVGWNIGQAKCLVPGKINPETELLDTLKQFQGITGVNLITERIA
jgi:DNA polymerase-3 subunit alpha